MSNHDSVQLKQILADADYRLTSARQATFEALVSPEPQSMRRILERTKGKADRVSVYRSIELFEKLGIVHRIYVGWKYKLELSDDFMTHHHHLTCLTCGKITDIKDEKHIDQFINTISNDFSFTPRRHQFEIDGYCMDCVGQRSLQK